MFVIENLNTKMFNAKNLVVRELDKKIVCFDDAHGLLGSEIFTDNIILLDFKNKLLKHIKSKQIPIKYSDYLELKVNKFDGYYFFVELEIDSNKIIAKIDTGNPFGLILRDKEFKKIKSPSIEMYTLKETKVNPVYKLKKNNLKLSTYNDLINIISKKSVKRNLLGMEFLLKYNWILDYNEGRVFCKKNTILEAPNYNYKTRFTIINHELIVQVADSLHKNLIGKKVLHVNNTKINNDNICYYLNVLNSSYGKNDIEYKK